eukprot:180155-Pelagomonas_calceolata.AAC.2
MPGPMLLNTKKEKYAHGPRIYWESPIISLWLGMACWTEGVRLRVTCDQVLVLACGHLKKCVISPKLTLLESFASTAAMEGKKEKKKE